MHADDVQTRTGLDSVPEGTPRQGGFSRWQAFAGLALLTLAAYLPAIRGDFVVSEDQVLTASPQIRSADGLVRFWTSTDTDQYQPLMYTSLWLEWRIWGMNAWGYRLTNVILHTVNAILVWMVLARIGVRGALAVAAIFALHPINVESVAWIYERKNVLSGLFFFLTLLAMLRFDSEGGWTWYAGAILLYAAALLTKASTVALPVVLLLYWWWGNRLWRPRTLSVIPLMVMALAMGIVTVLYEQHYTGATGADFTMGFAERFVRAGWLVFFYVGKLFVPSSLMFFYPRIEVGATGALAYLPHAIIVLTLVICLIYKRSWGRGAFFALASYLVALFPVLGFFNLYYQKFSDVADRFQYLPMIALAALSVHVVVGLLLRFDLIPKDVEVGRWRVRGSELGIAVVAICWLLTYQRASLYTSTAALCEDTLAKAPSSWIAHQKLGEYLLAESRESTDREKTTKQIESAVSHLEQTVAFNPQNGLALTNLGVAQVSLGRLNEGLENLRRAVVATPGSLECHYNLATTLHATGDAQGAIEQYQAALEIEPRLWMARVGLGKLLVISGRPDQGIPQLRTAVEDSGGAVEVRATLGVILCGTGHAREGMDILGDLARQYPEDPNVRSALFQVKAMRDRALAAQTQPAQTQPAP